MDINKVLYELSVFKEPKETKSNKPYYSIDEYWERMNTVLGRDAYRAYYSELKEVILPSGQVMLSCKCHLELLGDAGEVVFVTEGYGSEEIAYSSDNGKYIMLNTVALNCQIAAFKSACKELGIFGCRDMSVKGRYKGKSGNSGNSSGSSGGNSIKETVMEFFVKKPLTEFWKDAQGKPAYRMIAQLVKNGQVQDEEVEVLFYSNYYGKNTDTFNNLHLRCSDASKGFHVTLKCAEVAEEKRRNKDFSNSYVFHQFGG